MICFLMPEMEGHGGRIPIDPRVKGCGLPLSSSSAHHPTVFAWPIAMIRSMINLTPGKTYVADTHLQLQKWFSTAGVSEATFQQWARQARRPIRVRSKASAVEGKVIWVSLEWHPSFALLNPTRCALQFAEEHAKLLSAACGQQLAIKIAWKNGAPKNGMRFDFQSATQRDGRMGIAADLHTHME